MVRLGLSGLFSQYEDLEVIGEAATGEEAAQAMGQLRPDVVLLDIRLPGISGIDVCRLVASAVPGLKVIMLTSFAEPSEVQAAFSAGAAGYVLKNITSGNLIQAIKSVMRGETYLDPEITDQVLGMIRGTKAAPVISGLSEREEQILALVAEGKTNIIIGKELFLSDKTVRNHVSRILEKLGLTNRSQAAAYKARRSVIESLKSNQTAE